jgi:hypothetical protein
MSPTPRRGIERERLSGQYDVFSRSHAGSPAKVLRWITYPVKPFDLDGFQGDLLPSQSDGDNDRARKPPGLDEKAGQHLPYKI